jgi:hypothetical protein
MDSRTSDSKTPASEETAAAVFDVGINDRLAGGQLQAGGLGTAYGSFCVASIIRCALTVPIRGWSFIGLFARFLRAPIISGMIVMLIMIQIANAALPSC